MSQLCLLTRLQSLKELSITEAQTKLLYTHIDLKLLNKLHGPMPYMIGVTCVSMDTRYILCCTNYVIHLFQNLTNHVMNSH